jgi:2-polyprenyl-3-methyl-5-hydroxy-6-metoxy-1,4-benzoquinol methylase
MPSSNSNQISHIIEIVRKLNPNSVLDIGTGFGKFGFLCREYLELWDGREKYNDWQRRIDGIEVYEKYVTSLQKLIYDNIYIGNALDVVPTLDHKYDLIMIIDVLEHFKSEEGRKLLKDCTRVGRNILISTPKDASNQGAVFGNEYESHKSQWTKEQFSSPNMYIFDHPQKLIILFAAASLNKPAKV